MTGERRVSDSLRGIFERGREGSRSAPVVICALCRTPVRADDGTHRLLGSRWAAIHRVCPKGEAA